MLSINSLFEPNTKIVLWNYHDWVTKVPFGTLFKINIGICHMNDRFIKYLTNKNDQFIYDSLEFNLDFMLMKINYNLLSPYTRPNYLITPNIWFHDFIRNFTFLHGKDILEIKNPSYLFFNRNPERGFLGPLTIEIL